MVVEESGTCRASCKLVVVKMDSDRASWVGEERCSDQLKFQMGD